MNERNVEKEKQVDPLKTRMGKTYLRGLQHAVETGAISIVILQRKLRVGYAIGGQILDWMIEQGYVRNDSGYLKTTLITKEEFEELLQKTGISLKSKLERQSTVDGELYKACLRLAIRQNAVSEGRLKEAFEICRVRAKAVIEKMEQEGYIKYKPAKEENFERLWNKYEILITKEKFYELYGEEI